MITENQMQIKKNIKEMEKSIASVKRRLKRNQNITSLILASSLCLIIGAVMQMFLADSQSNVFYIILIFSLCIYVGMIYSFMKGYRKYEKAVKSYIKSTSHTMKVQQELLEDEER